MSRRTANTCGIISAAEASAAVANDALCGPETGYRSEESSTGHGADDDEPTSDADTPPHDDGAELIYAGRRLDAGRRGVRVS